MTLRNLHFLTSSKNEFIFLISYISSIVLTNRGLQNHKERRQHCPLLFTQFSEVSRDFAAVWITYFNADVCGQGVNPPPPFDGHVRKKLVLNVFPQINVDKTNLRHTHMPIYFNIISEVQKQCKHRKFSLIN